MPLAGLHCNAFDHDCYDITNLYVIGVIINPGIDTALLPMILDPLTLLLPRAANTTTELEMDTFNTQQNPGK